MIKGQRIKDRGKNVNARKTKILKEIKDFLDELEMEKSIGREYFEEAIYFCLVNDMKFIENYMYPHLQSKYNKSILFLISEIKTAIETTPSDFFNNCNRDISGAIIETAKTISERLQL